jgi:sugar diacid utilization regulator
MSRDDPGCTLHDLLLEGGGVLRLLDDTDETRGRVVSGARILTRQLLRTPDPASATDTVWVVMPTEEDYLALARETLRRHPGAAVLLWAVPEFSEEAIRCEAQDKTVILAEETVGVEEVLATVGRATGLNQQSLTRRLTSLQRSLTQALATPEPLSDLVRRLAKVSGSAVVVVDAKGTAQHATGPVPLTLLLTELNRAPGDSRTFSIGGWNGVAVRVSTSGLTTDKRGWVIAASRRATFPDPHVVAAVHVAASLVETSTQIDLLAQRQEVAVRSSLLEQVLAMRLERQDAELSGKVAALGFSFRQEVRTFLVRLPQGVSRTEGADAADRFHVALRTLLTATDAPHLLSQREGGLVGVVQAPIASLRRWLAEVGQHDQVVGIGRDCDSLGETVDSYHDAQLALRALARSGSATVDAMAYEDFDFATRLFSNIGLEKMTDWADDLLRPIQDQPILLEGLRRYFEHNLNTIGAAKALNVHHNSLRYRLAKIEELLGISLRDPSAISSLYLALTARSVSIGTGTSVAPVQRSPRRRATGGSGEVGNAVNSEFPSLRRTSPGAVVNPEQ